MARPRRRQRWSPPHPSQPPPPIRLAARRPARPTRSAGCRWPPSLCWRPPSRRRRSARHRQWGPRPKPRASPTLPPRRSAARRPAASRLARERPQAGCRCPPPRS
ncbi:hypothetical protein BU14_0052s0051 [Porphyra umbilicalis]|uniref:Uncharacterized protein n=1 Tax=Porphyra umbilicalis TaxID=2786 RepID=A0A1X6PHZ3_PORUM|nr:hypothetical protein BU14_0052s0051 [Porphyra umbilicalis]|eukprot:OSX80435.1 hypothetical protein BU14_0052s0051 [Porphyra umbilicalis]